MRYLLVLLLSMVIAYPASAAASVDPVSSRVSADKTQLSADGISNALVTVTVKDTNLAAMQGKKVVLTSSRGTQDEIRIESDTTDVLGKAYFRVFSLRDGTAIFSATIDGVSLDRTATITYAGGLSAGLQPGDLIKIPDDGNVNTLNDTAVYYYALNGKRYVFPNEKTYFTWYSNFSKVKTISIEQMSLVPIGGNVTYHPGSRLVKFQTDPKTYIVTRGGVLRWAKTEAVATGWFGSSWNTHVDDITEAFYVNYTFGEPVENHLDLALDVIKNATPNIDVDKGLTSIFQ
ncbi:Ig-like domain-containing protein [Patescibacteria group bacterium]|nr:Ig-like domain-containing protein [Patescibacteria group bacterium]